MGFFHTVSHVSLRGTDSHLNDEQIRLQLEAGLDEDLQQAACDAKTHDEKALHPWVAKIKELDNHRIIQCKRVAEAVEEAMKSNKKPFTSSSRYANTSDSKPTQTSSSSTTSFTRDYPPKLTDEEHRLLMDYFGCLSKCGKFFAGHRAHQCTTTISGKNYKTLTEKDAQRAKAAHDAKPSGSQINTVATVSDASPKTENEDFVAAVFPSGYISDNSFSGSDSSYASVSTPPPIKSKHFIWDCILNGPSVTFPVTKPLLIDNGCHMDINPAFLARNILICTLLNSDLLLQIRFLSLV